MTAPRASQWALVWLRTWADKAGAHAPSWYRGLADPVLAPALQSLHDRPARAWTVASLASLAARSGVSRALFTKRFTQLMGRPSLACLAECRLGEAAALLTDTDLNIAQIARSVGYADAFGFSAAFKRHKGLSLSVSRAATASAGTGSLRSGESTRQVLLRERSA